MVLNYEAADRFIKSHNSESEKPQDMQVDDESANLLAIGAALEADYAIVTSLRRASTTAELDGPSEGYAGAYC